MLDIEASNSGTGSKMSTGSKLSQSALLTAGLSKVVSDGVGDKSTVGQIAGIVGDAGDAAGKIFDTITAFREGGPAFKDLMSTFPSSNRFMKGLGALTTVTFNPVTTITGYSMKGYVTENGILKGVKNAAKDIFARVPMINKVLAPLAFVGGVVDTIEFFKADGKWDKAEKATSALSNLFTIGALLAVGTAAAPVLAVGALALGAGSLLIKHREGIQRAAKASLNFAKKVGSSIKNGITTATKKASNGVKKGWSFATKTGQKAWGAVKNGAKKAYSYAKKAASSVKNTAQKAASSIKAGFTSLFRKPKWR
ncbi:hypothetical protein P9711_00435 [Anoxybacillus geothermalis]|nr:hypothetical protein [Anoxybacillus geothermalis]